MYQTDNREDINTHRALNTYTGRSGVDFFLTCPATAATQIICIPYMRTRLHFRKGGGVAIKSSNDFQCNRIGIVFRFWMKKRFPTYFSQVLRAPNVPRLLSAAAYSLHGGISSSRALNRELLCFSRNVSLTFENVYGPSGASPLCHRGNFYSVVCTRF